VVKEAIQGFGSILIKDGKINVTKSPNYTSNRASRTAIGITAEGKVVMMVLDGRQLPRSAGGSMEEIATIMLEAGCVQAVNLDGGGSTTYLSKPAGSDEIQLVNVPSDGTMRNVSTSLVAISTAAPSTAFESAIISSDYEYITAGTSMQFNVTGVSNTGNAAIIPEGAYWTTSDANIGTIDASGLFTAVATGDVTVQFIVNGEAKGSKTIHVVIPDDIKFAEDRITAIYGQSKKMDITVWYKGYRVAFTPLKDAFVFFDYEFDQYDQPILYFTSDAGTINGLEFIGSDAKKVRTAPVYAALMIGNNIVATMATVNLYYADEATFDFANATQGNRSFAWIREIENAKTLDNQLYRISDPDSPLVIDYTFALDMTAIDFPAQLEPMKSMLPTYSENATAWDYLLQLAERVCTQTTVTIRAEFSQNLDVDISELKILTDYFTPTSINLDANNVLTIVCQWVNQTDPIDPATANSLCILTGIKATLKDTAAVYDNKIAITNNGNVSYDIYLAASSLYSFANDPSNQSKYGLMPYIHEEDCRSDFKTEDTGTGGVTGDTTGDPNPTNNDKGAHFASQYVDFADSYIVSTEILNGWHQEGKDYYYYVDNEPVTGLQLVPNRTNAEEKKFYEFDANGKLTSEQGTTGLITFEGDLYYAVLGVAQTGWQQIDGNNYYFRPDTAKAVDGVVQIRENANSYTTNWYTYTFEDHVLVLGAMVEETTRETGTQMTVWRYRWAGSWSAGWFDIGEDTYYAHAHAPYNIYTGFVRINPREGGNSQFHLFDDKGVLQDQKPMVHFDGSNYHYLVNGRRVVAGGLYEADGYYYFVNPDTGTLYVNQDFYVNDAKHNGLVKAGTYTFDEQGRLIDKLVDVTVSDKISGVTTEVIGRVTTVTVADDTPACKVGYWDATNEKYVTIEATKNGDKYNFAADKSADQVTIVVAGDTDGDGAVEASDAEELLKSILGKLASGEELSAEELLAADVNGDGKFTAIDAALINAAGVGVLKLGW